MQRHNAFMHVVAASHTCVVQLITCLSFAAATTAAAAALPLQVHGGTEEEGWAALAAARDALHKWLEERIRKRMAADKLTLSDEEVTEQAAAFYQDKMLANVRWLAGGLAGWLAGTRRH